MYIKVTHREAARQFAHGRNIYDDITWGTCFCALAPVRSQKARTLRALTRKMRRWDWNEGLYIYKKEG